MPKHQTRETSEHCLVLVWLLSSHPHPHLKVTAALTPPLCRLLPEDSGVGHWEKLDPDWKYRPWKKHLVLSDPIPTNTKPLILGTAAGGRGV